MTRPGDARPGAAATALAVPGRWAERALCAQADPDAWFPDKGHYELTQLARRICARCPVRAQCLEYALSGADTWGGIATGIWGGTTPQERDQLRQQRKAAAA
jgi:WhiB family transcriptional regulator, redox-sensing transcriptional regulator